MGFGKDGKGVIITQADLITLSTLANNTGIKQASPMAITEDYRIISMELAAQLEGVTSSETPIHLYLCNDELSVAEIAESITNVGPLDRSDRLQQERAERSVFLVGTFNGTAVSIPIRGHDGQEGIVKKTIRWTYSSGQGFTLVAFNQSGGTLTTGGVVRFVSKYYGVWVT